MKIAYLLGSLNRGGTETLMLDVFRNAASNELNAIGIYRKSGVLENDFLNSAIKMYHLKASKNLFSYLLRLRSIITANKIEVIHAQQPIDALFAYFACLFSQTRIVLSLHAYDFTETKLSKFILKFILKRTDLNIYVSDSQRTYYTNKYSLNKKNQKTIYNGIAFEKLDIKRTSNIRDDLKISSNDLLMGSVGNFVPGRDQFTICKFLNELKKQNIPFQFIFIGKPNEQTPERYNTCVEFVINNNLSDYVHFLGSRQDVPELLQQLDAFVYSTEHDTFGIAVVEAMACGLPVFVNNWDVMAEITENGKLATLYKTKDEKDLFNHFLLFLQDKQRYTETAMATKVVIRKKFSIEKHIFQLVSMYKNLLNK